MNNMNTKKTIEMTAFQTWFSTFNAEKGLPFESWSLTAPDGTLHILDTDVVKEAAFHAPAREQKQIQATIAKIDFMNGDVNDFYKHLAQGLVNAY